MRSYKQTCQEILNHADVQINGNRPWDIQVHNPKFYPRILAKGSLGLGESYMDGWWDCEALDQFFDKVTGANLHAKVKTPGVIWNSLKAKLTNPQNIKKSKKVAKEHYDLGNDLYENMLDKLMLYTCAYWKNAKDLDQAQEAKLKLVCEKIGLKKGMKVLDTGCGFGGFARYAAENYGVEVVAVNISEEQVKFARELCKGFPVKIILGDYRKIKGKFDRVVAIGLMEHIGPKNYSKYFQQVYDLLIEGGLFLVHTIGKNKKGRTDPWTDKYIFPGGVLPTASQITKVAEPLFVLEDWHSFGADYDKTLMAWHHNFTKNWEKLKDKYSSKVGGKFKRMWDYYLLLCAGYFRARGNKLWQIVFSKGGVRGGYKSLR